jgi:hypothetical protein
MKAWVLVERTHGGEERIEGVALTNEAASRWVHSRNLEPGQARTSLPHNIIDSHIAATDLLAVLHLAAEALDAYSDVNDGEDGFPRPNRAMSALQEIDEVILKAEGKPR